MIGLPASGKTTWAEKHCTDNPEKRFTILGTNLIMDKMKVRNLRERERGQGREGDFFFSVLVTRWKILCYIW